MTLSEKRQPKSKRFGLGFSVRTLLVFITLVAIALAIYERLTLPFKAVHFFNLKNSVRATRPHPKTLLYNIVGGDNAVVCHVGKARIVLLERTHRGSITSGFIPIAGDEPLRGGDVSSVTQEAFFPAHALTVRRSATCMDFRLMSLCAGRCQEFKLPR